MREHGTPAARFRLSSDGGIRAGCQDHEANLVEWIGRLGRWLLWPPPCGPSFCEHQRWTGHRPVATTGMKSMTIYFVAGEVSADNHGAALMRSLRVLDPELKFIGRGGPQMQQVAGAQFKNWIGDAAVLGLWEVLRKYGYFREQFRQTLNEIQESKPDAVVLIDYPGFNLRLARAL